ncbi:DUF7010 family protein [Gracilibacillus dipsosauri]|uniref:Uncharacterized protein n=1 Tax=Gracilibacillus dipsosauri TaxID=178340 RepID=A0A317L0V2_9BACI|nr:hypothetical protein [Gracilibacillus dipsosauri]PWU69255.1 hypothetical protein DLJ74_04520 [Gracilibacillus dipsosauri]
MNDENFKKEGEISLQINDLRKRLSISGKNGVSFLLSAVIIWLIITIIFLQPITLELKNIYMLFSTGLMFPLSMGLSNLLKADWKFEGNPLGKLGVFLNIAQLVYFPILFWAIGKSPEEAIIFFSIITAAHFFPYGWFYLSRPYFIMAPIVSFAIILIGWNLNQNELWLIPFSMIIFLLILTILLYIDYRKKLNS